MRRGCCGGFNHITEHYRRWWLSHFLISLSPSITVHPFQFSQEEVPLQSYSPGPPPHSLMLLTQVPMASSHRWLSFWLRSREWRWQDACWSTLVLSLSPLSIPTSIFPSVSSLLFRYHMVHYLRYSVAFWSSWTRGLSLWSRNDWFERFLLSFFRD